MLVTKTEPRRLAARQLLLLRKFSLVKDIRYLSPTQYSYEYVIGSHRTDYDAIYKHLSSKVWNNKAFPDEEENYLDYLLSIKKTIPSCLERYIKAEGRLVHGDCTLENILFTEKGIVLFDFGLPRGYTSIANDIGKLLQCWMTHWDIIKHQNIPTTKNSPIHFPVDITTEHIASLLTHWYRIIKNAGRHPKRVEDYGLEVVIPVLEESVKEANTLNRLRWDPNRLRKLYNHFLQESIRRSQ